MRFHIATTLVDASGLSPSTGVVNLYRKADGSLITGRKAYPDALTAQRRSRPEAGWTLVRQVSVADYQSAMPLIEAEARKAAVQAADRWLAGMPIEAPAVTTLKRVVKKIAAKKKKATKRRK